jgi:hypothetical protein
MSTETMKLSACKFGFAFGAIWALGVLLLGWSAWLCGYGSAFVALFSSVYLGYAASFLGAIFGALWGFVDFFIFAWLVAIVYNGCKCPRS